MEYTAIRPLVQRDEKQGLFNLPVNSVAYRMPAYRMYVYRDTLFSLVDPQNITFE